MHTGAGIANPTGCQLSQLSLHPQNSLNVTNVSQFIDQQTLLLQHQRRRNCYLVT